jgi:cation diffusion facilitator family transporter
MFSDLHLFAKLEGAIPHRASSASKTLLWAVALTLSFALVEALGGWWSGSLALLGDAAHMLSDVTALSFAACAARIAKRAPSARHSYGLGRIEAVAALINSLFMLTVVIGIVVSAIERLQAPQPVAGGLVFVIAVVGLGVNSMVALMLGRGEQTLNTRGAMLHVMGDLISTLGALLSGAVVYFTRWTPIDPILSIFICLLIVYTSLRLLRDVLHMFMEGVPLHLNLPEVGRAMARVEGVESVHDLHIWALSSGRVALSAHIVINDMAEWQSILDNQRAMLNECFGVEHITLQPEPAVRIVQPMRFRP